ncbi:excinuclease ABC subunit UvrC [Candidatus Nitrosocosmicus arcticus]|uniref:Excinuclease ABC C subunit n=1 Tax=Candidatus Nitrosocosmicus arcticus TaxID=2035267 RepID=A0A557SST5_9ARCH|nr:excinuclease ABC subunit UvrC [Candidatus Nitrosocosmicus arcticus]TVP39652.1 excinuclease ABC C subunit [Candidatus Nitrosocosmicus arcticus]
MKAIEISYIKYPYPHKPGVYIMKDDREKIIYIGKAKDLDRRIKSYFSKKISNMPDGNWKTRVLVTKIKSIDYIITDNEIEAYLLESNLIKKYRPIFNIELKDQQRYTYLKITDEKFPRLLVSRRNRMGEFTGTKGEVIGPFVKGSSRYLSVGLLRKMFKIRICTKLPKKECLEYHIGNCDAPCINKINEENYKENITSLKKILEDNETLGDFYKKLETEMKIASNNQNYERAIFIRDTLTRLQNLLQHQKMENNSIEGYKAEEYIGFLEDENQKIMHVMTLMSKNGVINDMKKYQFDLVGDNAIENFICQYYHSSTTVPNVIYLNKSIEEETNLQKALYKMTGTEVKIIPMDFKYFSKEHQNRSDDNNKYSVMQLILNNLKTYVEKSHEPALDELKVLLRLKRLPYIIDCFDISNFGNDFAVGACTRFMNGTPDKNGYRKFKIKKVSHQNDFLMMEEIIRRRYLPHNICEDVPDDKRIDRFPDLIVIDGGKGHLNVAITTLKKIGIEEIDCISLAKENEEVYTPFSNAPIVIPKNKKSLRILQHIRDESHRFGLTYNRYLRKKMLN